MATRKFGTGRIRSADYDEASQQLDLHWVDGKVIAYKHVPAEVFRRLCAAPNPTAYWEDRIAEEYPKATPRAAASSAKPKDLGDLFGPAPGDEPPRD